MVYSTRYPYPLRGKAIFTTRSKKANQKQKSWWRKIARINSIERKIHSVEHSPQMDVRLQLPSAPDLRKKLRGYTPIALKKVWDVTGDYFQGRWKNSLLEISWHKGLWQCCLRSTLTLKVYHATYGKRRNQTLAKLLGREVQFVSTSTEKLILNVLWEKSMPQTAPVKPTFGKVTLSSTQPELISDYYPDSLKETRVGHHIHVQGTQLFFTRK